ncbi:MAG: hypothetical protein EPN62_00920 [Candidimonas sp.]|nr:MAG: hypothetical protein EPN77_01920 [Candidimonas sp.]TAM26890.1 MAG: hypothetical protein EPN62_00920 [Candidimonas sp.]
MPTRIIREGILTSERINVLSPFAELFYRRLMSVVDDYGRYTANLTLLRASCYPLQLDSVKEDSIKKHLAECADAGLIVLFTVAGKAYLEMQDFNQRVQSKSKYPEPPGLNRGSLKSTDENPCSTVTHGEPPNKTALVVVEDEDVKHPLPPPSSGPVWQLPDWIPKPLWQQFEEVRKKRKKPLTDKARQLATNKLAALRDDGHDLQAVVEQTVLHAWDTFYPLKADALPVKTEWESAL